LREATLTSNDDLNNNLVIFLQKGFVIWASSKYMQKAVTREDAFSVSGVSTILEKDEQQMINILTNMILHNQQHEVRL